MKQDSYKEDLRLVGLLTRYNRLLIKKVEGYFGNTILDVGCGIGNLTQFFTNNKKVVGVDMTASYLDLFNKKFLKNKNVIGIKADISKKSSIKLLEKYRFDTIFCSNVLEHIKDDTSAMRHMHALLEREGFLIINVPALAFLYNALDKKLMHHRRYSKLEMKQKAEEAGFTVERQFYVNFLGIVGWLWQGTLLKRDHLTEGKIRFFDFIYPYFSPIDRILNLPGLALITVLKKEYKKFHPPIKSKFSTNLGLVERWKT